MKLILFVCRGNTCRSPMAEVAARAAAARAGIGAHWVFGSAGTAPSAIGAPADPRAMACVAAAGLDLKRHRTRAADPALLQTGDLVLALDRSVAADLAPLIVVQDWPRLVSFMSFAPSAGVDEVADPWAGDARDYQRAFSLIRAGVDGLVASLRTG